MDSGIFTFFLFLKISTHRTIVPHSRVGWFRPITQEHFHEVAINCFLELPRDQPTRLCDTGDRLVDIFLQNLQMEINNIIKSHKVTPVNGVLALGRDGFLNLVSNENR